MRDGAPLPGVSLSQDEAGLDDTSPERLLCDLAGSIAGRGLRTPALLAIELLRPLCTVGSHVYLLVEPLLDPGARRGGRLWADLLEDRENLDYLESILESL